MIKCESDIMSFPSDILSQDEQALILHDIADMDVANIFDVDSATIMTLNVDQEYKENLQFIEVPLIDALPPVNGNILSNEEYAGPFEFEVDIFPNGSKNPWVYSTSLNKIYMDINSPFPVDFKIKTRPHNTLFIRTTPVYSLSQHSQDFVYRCLNHEHTMEKNSNGTPVPENVRQHIIRCSNSAAIYLGDKNNHERLSVVIPFSVPQTGTESVREMFKFVCKNSCPTPGMNRRPIEVIFTLEDANGNILGRKSLNVRICSCPKRDKEKEEREVNKDRIVLPRGKKRKLEKPEKKPIASSDTDTKEYSITLDIVGKQNVQQILKYCHDLMAGEILRHANSGADLPYQKCLMGINNLMGKSLESNN